MDTYGLINLTELDRMIGDIEREMGSPITTRGFTTMVSEIMLLKAIKKRCLKLPSGEDVWNGASELVAYDNDDPDTFCIPKHESFADYIAQYTKSDKHGN